MAEDEEEPAHPHAVFRRSQHLALIPIDQIPGEEQQETNQQQFSPVKVIRVSNDMIDPVHQTIIPTGRNADNSATSRMTRGKPLPPLVIVPESSSSEIMVKKKKMPNSNENVSQKHESLRMNGSKLEFSRQINDGKSRSTSSTLVPNQDRLVQRSDSVIMNEEKDLEVGRVSRLVSKFSRNQASTSISSDTEKKTVTGFLPSTSKAIQQDSNLSLQIRRRSKHQMNIMNENYPAQELPKYTENVSNQEAQLDTLSSEQTPLSALEDIKSAGLLKNSSLIVHDFPEISEDNEFKYPLDEFYRERQRANAIQDKLVVFSAKSTTEDDLKATYYPNIAAAFVPKSAPASGEHSTKPASSSNIQSPTQLKGLGSYKDDYTSPSINLSLRDHVSNVTHEKRSKDVKKSNIRDLFSNAFIDENKEKEFSHSPNTPSQSFLNPTWKLSDPFEGEHPLLLKTEKRGKTQKKNGHNNAFSVLGNKGETALKQAAVLGEVIYLQVSSVVF